MPICLEHRMSIAGASLEHRWSIAHAMLPAGIDNCISCACSVRDVKSFYDLNYKGLCIQLPISYAAYLLKNKTRNIIESILAALPICLEHRMSIAGASLMRCWSIAGASLEHRSCIAHAYLMRCSIYTGLERGNARTVKGI